MKVLVVGLNPSRKGGNSGSLKTLHAWFDNLDVKVFSFTNIYQDYDRNDKAPETDSLREYSKGYDKVIALGGVVSGHLRNLDIDHFGLPHPSGLNRQLNDKKFVDSCLEACKNYLEGS